MFWNNLFTEIPFITVNSLCRKQELRMNPGLEPDPSPRSHQRIDRQNSADILGYPIAHPSCWPKKKKKPTLLLAILPTILMPLILRQTQNWHLHRPTLLPVILTMISMLLILLQTQHEKVPTFPPTIKKHPSITFPRITLQNSSNRSVVTQNNSRRSHKPG